jgi:hypothetical protein
VTTSTYDEVIIVNRQEILMILVHLATTWQDVLAGTDTAERATLEAWAQITDDALATYGDAILGIYQNEVVTAFEIDGWDRNADGRVVFSGTPSDRYEYLIGTPNPGRPWVRGQARPVQYLDTDVLTGGSVPVERTEDQRRAVISQYILTVEDNGSATLVVPPGQKVTVLTTTA